MDSFLESISKVYLYNFKDELKDYCFIFPNRRSSVFFRKHLKDNSSETLIFPQITTISDFIEGLAEVTIPSNLELLMTLYDEYQKILIKHKIEPDGFDKFIFWGNLILNDYNDIDKYLADAEKIFLNIKDYKEISSNFLTEDQKVILTQLGYKNKIRFNDSDSFWNKCSEIEKDFINIWEILLPLYKSFNLRLSENSEAYPGKAYKLAVNNLYLKSTEDLKYKKYIFIGFNMLSESEKSIFRYFKKKNIGDFYWDYIDNIFFNNESNKGVKFIKEYAHEFKSKYNFRLQEKAPNINIISVPSNSLQTKQAIKIINELNNNGKITSVNTAIVIPNEDLFIPILTSFPTDRIEVNLTYGFPLKFASISSLISSLTQLQNRAKKEIDSWSFFHEDVKNILSHPYLKNYNPKGIKSFLDLINSQRLYRVSYELISDMIPEISNIFKPIINLEDKTEIFEYLNNIIIFIAEILSDNTFELSLLNYYKKSLNELKSISNNLGFTIKGNTYLYLVNNLLSTQKVQFEGEPLKGIQIMGVLETRCLDFDNVIFLSMNEKIFPKKHFQKSFIPNNLRKSYNLSTIDHQESIFSYYFYRLISRAKNVNLIYDSRTQGISSGEPSRYIYQLKYLYNDVANITFNTYKFNIKSPNISGISIKKDKTIIDKLSQYLNKRSNKYLSASSIYKYIKCPLNFYLDNIENIKIEEEPSDFIEDATFGQIIHSTLQDIYTTDRIINNLDLEKIITHNVNRHYLNKNDEECKNNLEGEAVLIADIVKYYIENILLYDGYIKNGKYIDDKSLLPFKIIQCEKEEKGQWNIFNYKNSSDENLCINFKQYIDRVDYIKDQNLLRIIDYKSGNDETNINSISDIFDQNSKKNLKGIFQLFIYCNFYSYINKWNKPIKPIIYRIKEIKNLKNDFAIKIGKEQVDDYHFNSDKCNERFMEELKKIIIEIFNSEIPFYQTKNRDNCKYCKFKIICQR